MSRNNNGRRPRDGGNMRANQETRGGRVLKVFRTVDDDHASIIAGAVTELSRSNDIPPVTTNNMLIAYILDPRLMPINFNEGFLSGVQFGQVVARVERSQAIQEEGYPVKLGKLALLERNHRTLMVTLNAERLAKERSDLYRILSSVGVRGLTEQGERKGRHKLTGISVPIATFDQPISMVAEKGITEAVGVAIDIAFGVSEFAEVDLGALNVVPNKRI